MVKITSFAVAVLMLLTHQTLYAAEHMIGPNMEVSIEFQPNQEQTISNPLFWSISMACELDSNAESVPITAEAIKNATTINDYFLEEGKRLFTTLKISKMLYLKADGSAKVTLTNHAKHLVTATCRV